MLSYLRRGRDPHELAVIVCNFTPVPRHDYRIGVPRPGRYRERINTDAAIYGGSGVGNAGAVEADAASDARPCLFAARCNLPPLGVLIFTLERLKDDRGMRSTAGLARPALSAGRDLGRQGRQFRAVLGACRDRSSCACSIRSGHHEEARIVLPEYTDEVWHGYLPEARPGQLYGYRVLRPLRSGRRPPLQSEQAAARSLCARRCPGTCAGTTSLFGYRVGSPREDLSFDRRDSARDMPKCRVVETAFTWNDDRHPRTSWEETIIYEMHVRGFTIRHPGGRRRTSAAPSRRSPRRRSSTI